MHFEQLSAFFNYLGISPPENPQFAIVNLQEEAKNWRAASSAITTDFYAFALKNIQDGTFFYGRTRFDFQQGVMVFTRPGQVLQWSEAEIINKGYFVVFHKDFIQNTFLETRINSYAFFSYSVHEALHVSFREESLMMDVFGKLENEYKNVYDPYNKDIILSYINTLLSYAQRFYNRQFVNRKPSHDDVTQRFFEVLAGFRNEANSIPSVSELAQKLNVSPKYLSDLLKNTTGKTVLEHIHLSVLEDAKDILKYSEKTISEIAYELGFEYPQYFTRLFKNKVGVSPVEFRKLHRN